MNTRRLILAVALTIIAVVAVATVGATRASAYRYTVIGTIPHEKQIERATSWEANTGLAKAWPGISPVSFGPGGIPVYVVTHAQAVKLCSEPEAAGCHYGIVTDTSQDLPRVLYVQYDRHWQADANYFSHEVFESEVDPTGAAPEVCDSVEIYTLWVMRVPLADFAWPSFFEHNSHGPWDQERAIRNGRIDVPGTVRGESR